MDGQNCRKGDKKGRPKKGQKMYSPKGPKRKKKLVSLMVGNYFTHNPSNVANMQKMKSNNNKRFRTSIACQSNLPFYNRG